MGTFTEEVQSAINKVLERGGMVGIKGFGLLVKKQYMGYEFRTIGRPKRPPLVRSRNTLAQLVAHDVQLYQEMQEERFQGLFEATKKDISTHKAVYDDLTEKWHLKEYVRKDVFALYNIKTRIRWERSVYMYIECFEDEVLRGEVTI